MKRFYLLSTWPQIAVVATAAVLCLAGMNRLIVGDEKVDVAFGVIADAQYCDCAASGSRYYRASVGKLEEAVDRLNQEDLDFVIHLGDLIDRDFSSFDRILPIYDRLDAPGYHALGNHDFAVDAEHRADVVSRMGLERRYYEFSHASWRFIVLDGNDLSRYARAPGTEKYAAADSLYDRLVRDDRSNAKDWNGGLSRQQLRWLDRTLADASAADQHVVIFSHHPVFPPNAHNVWNDVEVVDVIQSYDNVAAVMSGHNHSGNYAVKDGIHFLTLKGMVETRGENAYAVVKIYDDRIEVKGFGRAEDRRFRY